MEQSPSESDSCLASQKVQILFNMNTQNRSINSSWNESHIKRFKSTDLSEIDSVSLRILMMEMESVFETMIDLNNFTRLSV
jgi:hypothetical protein